MSTIKPENDAPPAVGRRRGRALLVVAIAAVTALGARAWWADRRYRAAMAEVEAEIGAGRFAAAVRDLESLMAWRHDADGALSYLLACCEQARGRNREADAAWARVAPGTSSFERATSARVRLLLDEGRMADAENLVIEAARDPRNQPTALLVLLVPVYLTQGRVEEAARLLEARWEALYDRGEGDLEPAIRLLRMHVEITLDGPSIDSMRRTLDRAGRLAPGDDRVWLGRANLALRTGDLDEAGRRLDACLDRRPDDIPVWRARLEWAMATGRADEVRRAFSHQAGDDPSPKCAHRVNAWLAGRAGDRPAERRELEQLLAADPTDAIARDRLVRRARELGPAARCEELLAEQAEVDRALSRYRKLHERKQPIRDAEELARLADRLGRRFESRAFLVLAASDDPGREDLRRELARRDREARSRAAARRRAPASSEGS